MVMDVLWYIFNLNFSQKRSNLANTLANLLAVCVSQC